MIFFFFKQKTAYEIKECDWSSDVCSSDLQTDVTHIIIYAFKNIKEYDNFFKKIYEDFGETVEIKNSYVFSSGSIIKSSSKDIFLKTISELMKEREPIK